jgi:hypothetical protein
VGDGGKGIRLGRSSFDQAGDPDRALVDTGRPSQRIDTSAPAVSRIVGLAAQPFHLSGLLVVKQNGLTQHVSLIEGESRYRLNAKDRWEAIHNLICARQAARTESDFDLRHRSSP